MKTLRIPNWEGLENFDPQAYAPGRTLKPELRDPGLASAMKNSGKELRCFVNSYPGLPVLSRFHRFLQDRYYYQASGETHWVLPQNPVFDFDLHHMLTAEWTEAPGETIEIVQHPGQLFYLPLGLIHRRTPSLPSKIVVFLEEKVLLRDLMEALLSEFYPGYENDFFKVLDPKDLPDSFTPHPGWEDRLSRVHDFIRLKKYATALRPED